MNVEAGNFEVEILSAGGEFEPLVRWSKVGDTRGHDSDRFAFEPIIVRVVLFEWIAAPNLVARDDREAKWQVLRLEARPRLNLEAALDGCEQKLRQSGFLKFGHLFKRRCFASLLLAVELLRREEDFSEGAAVLLL